jgi:hypothetical protein
VPKNIHKLHMLYTGMSANQGRSAPFTAAACAAQTAYNATACFLVTSNTTLSTVGNAIIVLFGKELVHTECSLLIASLRLVAIQ